MYLSFKDVCLIILKSLTLSLLLLGLFCLFRFNYSLGASYCEMINIPKDLALIVVSPGMAIEIAIVMFVIEMTIFYFVIKNLKLINSFNNLCSFKIK